MPLAVLLLLSTATPSGDGYQVIHPSTFEASTFVPAADGRFQPLSAFDDDLGTAWVSAGKPEGAWIEWALPPLDGLSKVRVRVQGGDRSTRSSLASSGAPTRVRLELRGEGGAVLASVVAKLPGPDLVLPSDGKARGLHLRLSLEAVRPGLAYPGGTISEIETAVRAASPVSAADQEAVLAAVRASRRTAPRAEPEATAPMEIVRAPGVIESAYDDNGEARPGFRTFDVQLTSGKLTAGAAQIVDPDFLRGIQAMEALNKVEPSEAGFAPDFYLPAFVRPFPKLGETLRGLETSGAAWLPAFLEADGVAYLDAVRGAWEDPRQLLARAKAPPARGILGRAQSWSLGPVQVAWADAAHTRPERVYIKERWEITESREAWTAVDAYVLRYDADGHLVEVLSRTEGNGFGYTRLALHRQSGGAVSRVETARVSFDLDHNSFTKASAAAGETVARRE